MLEYTTPELRTSESVFIVLMCLHRTPTHSLTRSHDGSKMASQLTLQDSAGEELELFSLAPNCTVLLSLLLRWQDTKMGSARLR